MTRLVLASESTSRAKILTCAGLNFDARPSGVDEGALKKSKTGMAANDLAKVLAHAKARAVSTEAMEALVIGADQILELKAEYMTNRSARRGCGLTLGRCAGGSTN